MIGSIFSYILAILLLLGGSRERFDLLDTISADDYWQLKHVTPELAQLQKDADVDALPASIEPLIKDLGAAEFATRDKARRELERLGPAILPQLKPFSDSKDAEVAATVQDLVKKLSDRSQERVIRRLMAIRTLGERGEKAALPLLTTLMNSKELFVADYARRASAQINGQPYQPADLTEKLAGDLALMPADTAGVGQSSGLSAQRLTINALVEQSIANDANRNVPVMPGIPAPQKPDAKKIALQASEQLLSLLERVGNIRLDAITVGFNYTREQIKENPLTPFAQVPEPVEHGWFALNVRGQFDSAAAIAAFKELVGDNAIITPAAKPGDVTIITEKNGSTTILVPGNDQCILLTAPNEKDSQAIRDAFITALKSGKGTLENNKDLAALMKTVDTKSPLWAAGILNDFMTKQIMDEAFQKFTIDTKANKNGSTDFTFKAQTVDADKAKATAEKYTMEIKALQDDIKQEVQIRPGMQPLADTFSSIKVVAEGNNLILTGKIPADIINAVMSQLPLLELFAPAREIAPARPVGIPVDNLP